MMSNSKITYHDVEQRTPTWHLLRQKYPLTASNAQAIGNMGKGLETLVYEILGAKYSLEKKEKLSNEHLERGIELEPIARELYELETGNEVKEIGFVTNEKYELAGASPDGLVNDDGLLEIKAFDDTKHFILTLEKDFEIEPKYHWQMQMQMLITERSWCDFVAYNQNYKKSLLIKRVFADSTMQEELMLGITKGAKLLKEIEDKINK